MKQLLFLLFFTFTFNTFTKAGEPMIWTISNRAEVLRGEARGVSIDENGAVTLAPRLAEIYNTAQSYIWSSAADASGSIYLGTGSDGKVFKISPNGTGTLFYDSNELNVSAVAVGKSGEVFAGTSPDGKVYRIDASGNASVFFEPNEKYIWSLAVLTDGSLIVGTGENGKIYKVKQAGASAANSLLFDTSETHIISLAADDKGNFFAGTDSNGLVLRFAEDGKPFALLDSTLREIHTLKIGGDGSVYALALSNSVATKPASVSADATPTPTPSETSNTPQTKKSRYDLSATKSAVYRILPDGGSDIIWNSPDVAAFSITVNQDGSGVMIGTSDKGRIYSTSNDGREKLILQTNENQISTLFSAGQNFYATSSNQGKVFRFGSAPDSEGVYESPILDAKASAAWGRIWGRFSGNIEIQTRSGNTEKPSETWSAWNASADDSKGAQISSPIAKYFQWRAILKSPNAVLNEVNVSYLPRNIAPEILSIQILPTNVGLLPNAPVFIDPNIESSGLNPQIFGIVVPPVTPRKVYMRGAQALQWTAEDRNGDKLVYDIYYREIGEVNFKLLKENLAENFYSIDGLALADSQYIFKIVAKDSPSNPISTSLTGEKLSEIVEIDNSAPNVTAIGQPQISGDRARITFEAKDAISRLTRAEYSVNGGEWQSVYAADGISDSPNEKYIVEIPLRISIEQTVSLRVFDANGNAASTQIKVQK